jgi:hypothetical protein
VFDGIERETSAVLDFNFVGALRFERRVSTGGADDIIPEWPDIDWYSGP